LGCVKYVKEQRNELQKLYGRQMQETPTGKQPISMFGSHISTYQLKAGFKQQIHACQKE
jgi:hypothetical protein